MKKFEKGEEAIIHGVVISDFTDKLGFVTVEVGDVQHRVMAVPAEKLERVKKEE